MGDKKLQLMKNEITHSADNFLVSGKVARVIGQLAKSTN